MSPSALQEVTVTNGFMVEAPLKSTQDTVPIVSIATGSFIGGITGLSPIHVTAGNNPVVTYNGGSLTMLSTSFLQTAGGWSFGTGRGPAVPLLQPLATNAGLSLQMAPSGIGNTTNIQLQNSSDVTRTNTTVFEFQIIGTAANFGVAVFGTGMPVTSLGIGEPFAGGGANLTAINFKFNNIVKFAILPSAVQTIPVATSALPASPAGGMRASVNDATSPVVGVALMGGGGVFANVHYSPTTSNWIVDGI